MHLPAHLSACRPALRPTLTVRRSAPSSRPRPATRPGIGALLLLALLIGSTAAAQTPAAAQTAAPQTPAAQTAAPPFASSPTFTTSPAPRPADALRYQNGFLHADGLTISARDAYYYALEHDRLAAQLFERAAKIRPWNFFWATWSGLYGYAGTVELLDDFTFNNPSGALSVAFGGTLAGLVVYREKQRARLLQTAVARYNRALLQEEHQEELQEEHREDHP